MIKMISIDNIYMYWF